MMDSETSSTSDDQEETSEVTDEDVVQPEEDAKEDKIENEHIPEICVQCKECENPIAVQFLSAHRNYHQALAMLGYTSQKIPQSISVLLKRRNFLAKKLKSEVVVNSKASSELQKIDEAYELLRSYLDGTHDKRFIGRNRVDLDCRSVGLSCSPSCILAAGIGSFQNARWKNAMEDTRVFQDYYGNDTSKCFFAIYDGHNGRFAADIAANDLHHFLLKEMIHFDLSTSCTCALNLADVNDLSNYPIDRPQPIVRKDSIRHILHEDSLNILQQITHTCSGPTTKPSENGLNRAHTNRDPFSAKMSQAFKRAFALTDGALSFGVHEESRVRWSGCSALACMVRDTENKEEEEQSSHEGNEETFERSQDDHIQHYGDIYIANAGNVHAVLSRGGEVYQLSRDHSPANATEKQRLVKAGVPIHLGGSSGKASGILEATRGLGNHGDPLLKSAILSEPYTVSTKIDQYAEFLILASNGLWEVLTSEEAVEIVKTGIELEHQDTLHGSKSKELYEGNVIGVHQQESVSSQDAFDGQTITDQNLKDANVATDLNDTFKMDDKNDFESMISSLMEDEGRNEADIDALTKLHTNYTMSHQHARPSREEQIRSIAEKSSERLVQAAILAGAKNNITVMVILLHGCGIDAKG